ncbi:MAG: hypothetical protein HOI96_02155 [Rhodospirillaceae bacterium]|jgi:uncharacterized membrane protein YbaN (DUF454 family)|nr:hypothetical protein [Rhodospirillaceae bacterium]MBT6283963.1 hypothetical protein [Rhodospirillaceae bacterium]
MKQRLKRYAVLALGWLFIFLGILGLFLPILQGILFLTIGLILLSRESEWAAGKLDWLKTRYPRFGKTYDEADRRAMRLWERLRGRKKPD